MKNPPTGPLNNPKLKVSERGERKREEEGERPLLMDTLGCI